MFGAMWGNTLDDALQNTQNNNQKSAVSQEKIDALDEKTQKIVDEYRSAMKELESLENYNRDVEKMIVSQNEQLGELELAIKEAELAKHQIMPLFNSMVVALENLVAVDLPFLKDARKARVEKLKAIESKSDVSVSEKFRTLFEAYLIEDEYGNTIGSYESFVNERPATFLRVGRIGLWALSGDDAYIWNKKTQKWQPCKQRDRIAKAINVANKTAVPNLLILPFFKDNNK